jgi:hypothetical protein
MLQIELDEIAIRRGHQKWIRNKKARIERANGTMVCGEELISG